MERINAWDVKLVLLVALWAAGSSCLCPVAFGAPASFRQHVSPLFVKLGCNVAACHGSADGQGGFHLSLFGYDLKADHEALVSGEVPRANWKDPAASLILRKPSGLEEHGGGKLFEPGGFEYNLLLEWLKDRAPGMPLGKDWLEVEQLEILPGEIVGVPGDAPTSLQVIAHWNSGAREEVTRFCRFQIKDDSVASVTRDGEVQLEKPGMTHVLVYYDRAIQPVEVVVPFASHGELNQREVGRGGPVDAAIDSQLHRLRLSPAQACTDLEFLRRVCLDLAGRLPRPVDVEGFLEEVSPDKRKWKVDELLAEDAYADHWASWLCELLGVNEAVMPDGAFRREEALLSFQWIRQRIKRDVGYDELVKELVRGVSRKPGQSLVEYSQELNDYLRAGSHQDFAEQDRLPFYRGRSHIRSAADKAMAFSHSFLAVRLQCAQCHKHPFDRWTKSDFEGLEAFFEPLRFGTPQADLPKYDQLRESLRSEQGILNDGTLRVALAKRELVPLQEAYFDEPQQAERRGSNRLEVLTNWLQDPQHPYLAIAIVNRVWEHYFGVGIVDTPDDLSAGNPPTNRALLVALVLGFIESGHSLKWLHREIVLSQAYQRSSSLDEGTSEHLRQFAQSRLRPLPAEVLYDAVQQATSSEGAPGNREECMTGPNSVLRQSNHHRDLLGRLGQPGGEEVCQRTRSNEPTLPRALELYNGPGFRRLTDRPNGWIASLPRTLSEVDIERAIHSAYLRTVSRAPTERELDICLAHCQEVGDTRTGIRDVLWSLLNSREFLLNH